LERVMSRRPRRPRRSATNVIALELHRREPSGGEWVGRIAAIAAERFPDSDLAKFRYLLGQSWAIGADMEKLEMLTATAPNMPTVLGRIYAEFQIHEDSRR
jgi:hypothetical protein